MDAWQNGKIAPFTLAMTNWEQEQTRPLSAVLTHSLSPSRGERK